MTAVLGLAEAQREAIASALLDSYTTRRPTEQLSVVHPGLTEADAYDIQQRQAVRRLAAGARVVGHKVGLTSAPMRRALGVNVPDYGHLFDDMALVEGELVRLDRFIAPRIEPEIAFVLARTLRGPGVTVADVIESVAFGVPALELIDSRIRDWQIGLTDTVADNGSSGAFLLGAHRFDVRNVDLRLIGCLLSVDGQIVEIGAGGAVLGHPLASVAWLANALGARGTALAAGAVVLSGSLTAPVYLRPGTRVTAELAGCAPLHLEVA